MAQNETKKINTGQGGQTGGDTDGDGRARDPNDTRLTDHGGGGH